MDNLGTFAIPAGAAFLIQQFINVIKALLPNLPKREYILPALALFAGYGVMILSAMTEGATFNKPTVARVILQGAGAGFGAIMSTELHKLVRKPEQVKEEAVREKKC